MEIEETPGRLATMKAAQEALKGWYPSGMLRWLDVDGRFVLQQLWTAANDYGFNTMAEWRDVPQSKEITHV